MALRAVAFFLSGAVALVEWLPPALPVHRWFVDYRRHDPFSFGALQRAVQVDPATSGRKVCLLQAANIAGCTAGSLAAGLVLLERIGTASTLSLLVAAGGVVFHLVRARSRASAPASGTPSPRAATPAPASA